jgi:hypothetical protein
MLLVCTYLANSMSVTGASWATKLAGKWSIGATAFAFRNTARWGLQRGAQRWKSSRYANIPIAGRAIGNLLDRGAKSSFDLRGTKVAQNIFKAAHIDAGEVEKGGFAEIEKKRIEEREKYAKSLKQTQQDKDREAAAKETKRQRQRTYDADMSTLDAQHTAQLQPLETNVAQARARLNQARAAGNATAIHTEELSLNNALQDLAQLRQRQQEYRKGLENVHNAEIALLDKEIANTKTEQMRRYARGLRLGLSEDHWINRMVNPYRNTEAAHHIEEFANKSKEDRDRETLVTALQNAATRVGAPSGGGAAPAPAPTGGGHP